MNAPPRQPIFFVLRLCLVVLLALPHEAFSAVSEANIDGRLVITNSLTYILRQGLYALGPIAIGIWAIRQGRVFRFFGVIIFAMAAGLAVFMLPEAVRQELIIGLDEFEYRPGGWSDAESKPIRYSEVSSMELKVERSNTNPSKVSRYLVIRSKTGKTQNHSLEGVFANGGLERLFDQAATSGVQVLVPVQ